MEIIVPEGSMFVPEPVTKEKPIVVYGTSIAQGGCASRPGMAWPAILNRKMDRPVINLGFSGNGRLEKEVLSYIADIDARVYLLDCLPNLTGTDSSEVGKRIRMAVMQLREKRENVPILLVEHCSFTDGDLMPEKKTSYERVNRAMKETFSALKKEGVKNLFLLTMEDLGQDIETMVDGIHPNDLGMLRYAEGYEKSLRKVFNEPVGTASTMIPVTQYRDAAVYDWTVRHEEILSLNIQEPVTLLVGNSITHFWGGEPLASIRNGAGSWDKYFTPLRAVNLGYGWDRIENVLWRVYHGELDGCKASHIVLNIGTNNLSVNNTDQEIIAGLKHLISAVKWRQPSAKILLLGIYPRRNMEKRVEQINTKIEGMARSIQVKYLNPGIQLLQKDKKINEGMFTDGLHPNEKGYELLGAAIGKALK